MKAYIKGIASYLPVHVEYNDAESRITKKTGIYERHIAAAGECSSDMAACAAEKLFAKYGMTARQSTSSFCVPSRRIIFCRPPPACCSTGWESPIIAARSILISAVPALSMDCRWQKV